MHYARGSTVVCVGASDPETAKDGAIQAIKRANRLDVSRTAYIVT